MLRMLPLGGASVECFFKAENRGPPDQNLSASGRKEYRQTAQRVTHAACKMFISPSHVALPVAAATEQVCCVLPLQLSSLVSSHKFQIIFP